MLLDIRNDRISLTVDSRGAEFAHLQSADGVEYLWQGDSRTWTDRAPVLFPFIARLTNDSYRYMGKTYPMNIHGFAAASKFAVAEHTDTKLVLVLTENEETLRQYPFRFCLEITYELIDSKVAITYRVENRDDKVMPFGIGGHPGFRVPLVRDEEFTDYQLEFSVACNPDRVGFTPALFLGGADTPYPFEDGKRLRLNHALFDEDAIILKNMAREITLRSQVSGRGVRVSYPDFPYLGIWHWPNSQAEYVCIEPWLGLPSRQDIVEELTCKSDMVQLPPGDSFQTTWNITLF